MYVYTGLSLSLHVYIYIYIYIHTPLGRLGWTTTAAGHMPASLPAANGRRRREVARERRGWRPDASYRRVLLPRRRLAQPAVQSTRGISEMSSQREFPRWAPAQFGVRYSFT